MHRILIVEDDRDIAQLMELGIRWSWPLMGRWGRI